MDNYYVSMAAPLGDAFLLDQVTLNFGPFHNQRLYYDVQDARCDTIPVGQARNSNGVHRADFAAIVESVSSRSRRTVGAGDSYDDLTNCMGLIGPAS